MRWHAKRLSYASRIMRAETEKKVFHRRLHISHAGGYLKWPYEGVRVRDSSMPTVVFVEYGAKKS